MPTGIFQSTPPARGATLRSGLLRRAASISIHAPREGGDEVISGDILGRAIISIHAPREGGDGSFILVVACSSLFQSTPPARGATFACNAGLQLLHDFNPRPPRGGRHKNKFIRVNIFLFQSTPPARGATYTAPSRRSGRRYFNPRPPRGGRPRKMYVICGILPYFNPRPPRGGRR